MSKNVKKFISLATRLSFWIVLLGVMVFSTVLGANYYLSRHLLEDYVGDLALKTVSSTRHEIETIFNTVASDARSLATLVSDADMNQQQIHRSIKAFIGTNPDIFGMTVALEPNVLLEDLGEYSPYYFRKDDGFGFADLADPDYRYLEWDWYTIPKELNASAWSEPYLDTGGGNVLMTTYSVPIWLEENDVFAGVATADIELDWLKGIVKDIKIGDTGFGFIVSNKDIVLAHPDASLNMKPLSDLMSEEVRPANWQNYVSAKGDDEPLYFKAPCRHRSGDCWAVVESIGDTGWRVIIVIPDKELQDDINALTFKVSVLAVIGILILVFVIVSITRYLINPLGQLARATREIGSGALEAELPEPIRRDEIGLLTSDFSKMRDSLMSYIEELTETTAKKQQLESEIQIAQGIQMSMVPGAGQSSIESANYELYALLRPARTVGGDLYYFQQDENLLHFIIGDVSGKGVPAALFMAKTVTLYNSDLKEGMSPGDIFSHMNDALSQNNDACMFVTALCGTLELNTGKLIMANAGHMHPIQHGIGARGELPVDGRQALGLMEGLEYPNVEHQLVPGMRLLMYTDGISEAFNSAHEQYEDERLLAFVDQSTVDAATALGEQVMGDVENFVDGAEQSDDITLMVIQYGG